MIRHECTLCGRSAAFSGDPVLTGAHLIEHRPECKYAPPDPAKQELLRRIRCLEDDLRQIKKELK